MTSGIVSRRAAPGRHRLPRTGLVAIAGPMFGTTIVTSVLGVAYWWLAARIGSPEVVGLASTVINTMGLAGAIGMCGLGSMLIGELGAGTRRAPELVSASVVFSGLASAAVGLVLVIAYALLGRPLPLHLPLLAVPVFIVACALTGAAVVLDQGLVGAGAGSVQLTRNTVFAAAKLLLVPAAALVATSRQHEVIAAGWSLGIVASLAWCWPQVRRTGLVSRHPGWDQLRDRWRTAMAHNTFNVSAQFSRLGLPIVATALVGAAEGGAFFVAWTLAGLAYIVPSHFSTALFALGAGRQHELPQQLRGSLRWSLLAGALGVPIMVVFAALLLRVFGAEYADAAAPTLRILGLAYVLMLIKYHYIAVTRVRGDLLRGSVVTGVAALLEVVLAAVGASLYGLNGLTLGFVIALALQSIPMTVTIVRAARQDASAR